MREKSVCKGQMLTSELWDFFISFKKNCKNKNPVNEFPPSTELHGGNLLTAFGWFQLHWSHLLLFSVQYSHRLQICTGHHSPPVALLVHLETCRRKYKRLTLQSIGNPNKLITLQYGPDPVTPSSLTLSFKPEYVLNVYWSYSGIRRYLSRLNSGKNVSHSNWFRIRVMNSLLVAGLSIIS